MSISSSARKPKQVGGITSEERAVAPSITLSERSSSFPLDVLFGVLLGAIFIQWQARQAAEAS